VRYGAKGGNCVYKGHTFSGTHTITVSKSGTLASGSRSFSFNVNSTGAVADKSGET
jgi:hypothetical protein